MPERQHDPRPQRHEAPGAPRRSRSELVLASIAAHGLPVGIAAFPTSPLDAPDWLDLLGAAREQRVLGWLVEALRQQSLPATADQHAAARAAFRASSMTVLGLEQQLLDVVAALDESGIPVRVLKGPATARTLYAGCEGVRSFVDIDLLVPGEQFEEAGRVAVALGGCRRHLEPRRGFDRRFSKAVTFGMPSGLAVDLHRTLAAGPYGFTVDPRDLFVGGESFCLGGRELQGIERHNAFLHACLHSVLGDRPPRLVPLRDVAQFLVGDGLDLDLVVRRAMRWKVEAVVAQAVLAAQSQLSPDHRLPLGSWASSYRMRRWEPHILDVYVGEQRAYPRQLLAALPFVPGVRGKVSYMSALAFPQGPYVKSREGSYRRRWRHALEILFRRRSGGSSPG